MDTPWRGTFKQQLARYALRGYLSHIDMAMVTGERCWQYARRLGFPEAQIRRGVYGVDDAALSRLHQQRLAAGPWPRQFLFAGRYAPEKGLDVLLDAYARYARVVEKPWPLVCCGKGPLAQTLRGQDGVVDRGFLQPHEVHAEMVRSGAFILPSLYDPWPLALVESSAAGLPVICSNACGSAVEIVRDGFSGFTCATGDAGELLKTLLRVHHATDLAAIGSRARDFAAPYSAEEWATRWLSAAAEACREKRSRS
jgi:glycosyltransferase involved in cell wall biosynthesis